MKPVIFVFCLFSISCMTNKVPHSSQFSETAFDKQGHRGCRGLMPENTIAAMYKAIDLGVTTLEMDASISKDDQVFLSHEPFFNHEISLQPNGKSIEAAEEKSFNMYQLDYAQIIKFDVGLKPHPRFPQQVKLAAIKPLLSQVFDSVVAFANKQANPFLNLILKQKPHPKQMIYIIPNPINL